MASINIGGDKNDENYRYKMPPLSCVIEGRGHGLKTAFINIADVAKALHVMPQYIIKYFGFELGTQSGYDEATSKGIVNGKHEFGLLQNLLEKFIDVFVLCPKCKLPEINLSVSSKETIRYLCASCGAKADLKTSHKLTSYIVNHPPPKKAASGAHKNAEKEKAKQDEKVRHVTPIEKKDVEWKSEASLDAQRARLKRDLGELTPEEAEKRGKIEAIIQAAKELGAEKSSSTLLNVFLVQSERSVDEIYHEIRRLQLSRSLDDAQKLKLILEVFIDVTEPKKVPQQFENARTRAILTKFISPTDRSISVLLINCIEDFVGVIHPKLLPLFPLILKSLYENDILTEEAIVAWYQSSAEASWVVSPDVARQTRAKAQPLIDWLQDDDEDGDDEDGDDEDAE
jgi:translation initiation factor 5